MADRVAVGKHDFLNSVADKAAHYENAVHLVHGAIFSAYLGITLPGFSVDLHNNYSFLRLLCLPAFLIIIVSFISYAHRTFFSLVLHLIYTDNKKTRYVFDFIDFMGFRKLILAYGPVGFKSEECLSCLALSGASILVSLVPAYFLGLDMPMTIAIIFSWLISYLLITLRAFEDWAIDQRAKQENWYS